MKQSWWNSILHASQLPQFPLFVAATWFEERKNEEAYQDSTIRVDKDYRITFDPNVRNAFLNDVNQLQIEWADLFTVACNGNLVPK